jgi:Predicted membrane-associated HD superfamily hydrolase
MSNLTKFADYEDSLDKKSKLKLLLRLSLYSFILSIWVLLLIEFSISYFYFPISSNFFQDFILSFFLTLIFVIPFGIAASLIILAALKYCGSIGGSLALGIVLSAIIASDFFAFSGTTTLGITGAMTIGITLGIGSGITFGILAILSGFKGIGVGITIGTIFGIAAGIAGIIWGIFGVGINIGIIFGIAFGISLNIAHKLIPNTDFNVENCILFSVIGCIFTSFVIGAAGGIAESISFFIFYYWSSDIFSSLIKYMRAKYSNYHFNENKVKDRISSVKDIPNKKSAKISVSQEQS